MISERSSYRLNIEANTQESHMNNVKTEKTAPAVSTCAQVKRVSSNGIKMLIIGGGAAS